VVIRRRRSLVRGLKLPREAAGAWEQLDAPWRHAFQLAWEAYRTGTVPIGAVVIGGDGKVLGRDRDHVYDTTPHAAPIQGNRLAHAELNALTKLDAYERYEDAVLYTTVEPCALCVGAAITTTVGTIRYASLDPYGGAAGQVPVNEQTDRLPMRFEGPLPGVPGLLGAVLRLELYLRTNPDAHLVQSHRRRFPEALAIAEDLRAIDVLAELSRAGASFNDVLPHLWAAADRILAA
jgi:tRNA(Arg) A34 adenosine deaminase TadA